MLGSTAGGLRWWTARWVLDEPGLIVAGDHIAGRITSSRMSPALRPSICLAQVAGLAWAGTEVTERLPSGRLIARRGQPQLAIPIRSGSEDELPAQRWSEVLSCRSHVAVRDYGLLEAALARPQATAFGKDAYPSLDARAAALLHSLARNHALIDGNKRLSLAAVIAFNGLNGRRLTFTNDEAYDLVMKVAAGELDQVEEITAVLQGATAPRN